MRILIVGFIGWAAGCATTPAEQTQDWPCGSIASTDDVALRSIRYQYDELHNVVSEQVTSLAAPNAGTILSTETRTYQGKIAVTEEYVGRESHTKVARTLVDGRIVNETFSQDHESPMTARWMYDGDRVVRIDRQDAMTGASEGYSVFSYPDANTRVERNCTVNGGTEEVCSTETRIGGIDTWTTLRDVTADGTSVYEETRTLDPNGLPTVIEGAYVRADGTRHVIRHVEIERRADGAPIYMDDGHVQTTYQLACQ